MYNLILNLNLMKIYQILIIDNKIYQILKKDYTLLHKMKVIIVLQIKETLKNQIKVLHIEYIHQKII